MFQLIGGVVGGLAGVLAGKMDQRELHDKYLWRRRGTHIALLLMVVLGVWIGEMLAELAKWP